jgi:UDP-N-acetylglucosamine transferase subunit ALG13
MTFVSVGNAKQLFRRFLNEVAVIASKLPQPVIVQHGHTPFECPICKAKAFMDMEEFSSNIKNAELLIMHAGAGSVIHAIEAGKVPVVMPRRASFGEHVNDHQVEFAEALARAGRVIMIESPEELESAVAKSLSVKEAAKLMDRGSRMVSLVRNKLSEIASKVDMGR